MGGEVAVTTLIDFSLSIGESPVWDPHAGVLWFIDIEAPAIFRLDPVSGRLDRFPTPQTVASLGLAGGGRLVVALRNGVHLFDPQAGVFDLLAHPEPNRPANRLNDGKVGPDGAFWVGSMSEHRPYQPTGAFYRVAPSGEIRCIRQGIHVSNGLAWSPDGRTLYHADSVVPEILAYGFEPATGALTEPRVFARFDPDIGRVDGAAVDAEGCYWCAGITAGRLNRFSPAGALMDSLPLPIRWPTMPCFGGPDLRTLYLTSLAREEGGVGQVGSLVSLDVGVAGLPPYVFGA
ncbi:MAG: SMP-30/gluconolactonase/LRE family protein [Caulobacteraceae bacterium]